MNRSARRALPFSGGAAEENPPIHRWRLHHTSRKSRGPHLEIEALGAKAAEALIFGSIHTLLMVDYTPGRTGKLHIFSKPLVFAVS